MLVLSHTHVRDDGGKNNQKLIPRNGTCSCRLDHFRTTNYFGGVIAVMLHNPCVTSATAIKLYMVTGVRIDAKSTACLVTCRAIRSPKTASSLDGRLIGFRNTDAVLLTVERRDGVSNLCSTHVSINRTAGNGCVFAFQPMYVN